MAVNVTVKSLRYKQLLFRYKYHCINENAYFKFCATDSTRTAAESVTLSRCATLNLSTGRYARFANGCAVATIGDTSVMVTTVCKPRVCDASFVPLVVDYKEKAAAAGRIPTNFLRREIGSSEHEILTSRLIDRSLRPLFPERFSSEVQVTCSTLAIDGVNDPVITAINGASAALSLSDIPWNGPVGAVRIGMINDEIIISPSRKDVQKSNLNLIVATTKYNLVIMIEGSADDILEQDLKRAIKLGVKKCQSIIQSIMKLQAIAGKQKMDMSQLCSSHPENWDEILETVKSFAQNRIRNILTDYTHDKISRDTGINQLREEVCEEMTSKYPDTNETVIRTAFNDIVKNIFRALVFETNIRCDGRKLDELRNITCQVNLFKPLHGSAIFQRGQTQVLCTVTLDSLESALKMDTISMLASGVKEKNFFLHYEFPPYATNEIGSVGRIGRREIGHGALAEKGLRSVVPKDYPFTIRLTSEVLESNGSSSMATVCSGSLALMDAGVPISSPVAGVAIGLMTKHDSSDTTKQIEDYRILTDILGMEDYLGDMDFKMAGGRKGFTALQLDLKIPGLPIKILMESIQQATVAKNHIINIMHSVLPGPRSGHSDKMPVVEDIEIPIYQRGKFLGVGGINVKKLLVEIGVQVSPKDDTTYSIFAPNEAALKEAKEFINSILKADREPILEFGTVYTAKIVEIREVGVMVTLHPNMVPALLPNSQLDQRRIMHPSALGLEVGQELQVKYFGRDPVTGQMRLSRKVLQEPVSVTKRSLLS